MGRSRAAVPPHPGTDPTQENLLLLLSPPNLVLPLGEAYWSTREDKPDAETLVREIFGDPPAVSPAIRGRPLAGYLEGLIHDDFEAARTVLVGGWVLAATEVRLAALAFLLDREGAI